MSHNAKQVTPDYGRYTEKVMLENERSQTITHTKGKPFWRKLAGGPSDDPKRYINAMVKDIREAQTPKQLRDILHPKALSPQGYQKLSDSGRAAIICKAAVKLWEFSQDFPARLSSALNGVLYPGVEAYNAMQYKQSLGWSPGDPSHYNDIAGWPKDLLHLYEWVERNWLWLSLVTKEEKSRELEHLRLLAKLCARFSNDTRELREYLKVTPVVYNSQQEKHFRLLEQHKSAQVFAREIEQAAAGKFSEGTGNRYAAEYKCLLKRPPVLRGGSASTTPQSMRHAVDNRPPMPYLNGNNNIHQVRPSSSLEEHHLANTVGNSPVPQTRSRFNNTGIVPSHERTAHQHVVPSATHSSYGQSLAGPSRIPQQQQVLSKDRPTGNDSRAVIINPGYPRNVRKPNILTRLGLSRRN